MCMNVCVCVTIMHVCVSHVIVFLFTFHLGYNKCGQAG